MRVHYRYNFNWKCVMNFTFRSMLWLVSSLLCIIYRYPKWNATLSKQWNWSSCTKLALSASWTRGLIAQSVRASERNSVVVVQIPLRPTLYSYFKESFGDEYHMFQLIPLHSYDYLNKISISKNVVTDQSNSRNEMRHWTNHEIGVAVQHWLWVRVELVAW